MKTFKIVLVMVVVLVALTGCKSGGGGGGSDDPVREFKINAHELIVGDKDCYFHHQGLGYSILEIVDVCGVEIIAEDVIMDYEHVYGIRYYTVNDQKNTRYMDIDVFDAEYTLETNHVFEFDLNGQPRDALLYPNYIVWLEDDGNTSSMYTVEAWLTDSNGVHSPVYVFDIETVEQ
jgi:hypothetical protein